jgi:type 1 glutamine amidotransferase
MPKQVLMVGGCEADFHNMWEAVPTVALVADQLRYDVTISRDRTRISASGLAGVDALLVYTTGGKLEQDQAAAFLDWVRAGGGVVGLHSAADSFKENPEYIRTLGGAFITHPAPLDVTVQFVDKTHPVTAGLEDFTLREELYILDYEPARVHVLAETYSYEDKMQPIAWTREEGNGRIFYCSLGHHESSWVNENVRTLLRRGLQWVMREI